MPELSPWTSFAAGLVIILLGAEMVLQGASRLALLLGVKPILIGLTIVSVGTSAPELAVGIAAVLEGKGAMAVGNIAGTNIVNILLILGLSAAMRPLPLRSMSIRLDVPVMIAASLVLWWMASDGQLTAGEGMVQLALAALYTVALIWLSRKESPTLTAEYDREFGEDNLPRRMAYWPKVRQLGLLLVGMALTVFGADLLVLGAAQIGRDLGISDAVIGLTIVAIGTSAPELATTVMSTLRNDRDVAVGNLIGSSITNIFVILGLTCVFAGQPVPVTADVLQIDLPLSAAVALVCYPVFRSDQQVSRKEGLAFVAAYVLYLGLLLAYRT